MRYDKVGREEVNLLSLVIYLCVHERLHICRSRENKSAFLGVFFEIFFLDARI